MLLFVVFLFCALVVLLCWFSDYWWVMSLLGIAVCADYFVVSLYGGAFCVVWFGAMFCGWWFDGSQC